MFNVNDRVYSIDRGWGTVISILDEEDTEGYPVRVMYDEIEGQRASEVYTLDGKYWLDANNQGIFFEEIVIPERAKKPKWRSKFKKGDIVLRTREFEKSVVRVVSREDDEDNVYCYTDSNISGHDLGFSKSDYQFEKIGEIPHTE